MKRNKETYEEFERRLHCNHTSVDEVFKRLYEYEQKFARIFKLIPTEFTDDYPRAIKESKEDFIESIKRLEPKNESRWSGVDGRVMLAAQMWRSGWDAAIAKMKKKVEE